MSQIYDYLAAFCRKNWVRSCFLATCTSDRPQDIMEANFAKISSKFEYPLKMPPNLWLNLSLSLQAQNGCTQGGTVLKWQITNILAIFCKKPEVPIDFESVCRSDRLTLFGGEIAIFSCKLAHTGNCATDKQKIVECHKSTIIWPHFAARIGFVAVSQRPAFLTD